SNPYTMTTDIFTTSLHDALPIYLICNCNATQVKQILINLVLNAMESMDEKGTVTLRAYQSNDFINIDIIDEGTGVEEGILKELRSEEHTSELQSRFDLVCRLLLE